MVWIKNYLFSSFSVSSAASASADLAVGAVELELVGFVFFLVLIYKEKRKMIKKESVFGAVG